MGWLRTPKRRALFLLWQLFAMTRSAMLAQGRGKAAAPGWRRSRAPLELHVMTQLLPSGPGDRPRRPAAGGQHPVSERRLIKDATSQPLDTRGRARARVFATRRPRSSEREGPRKGPPPAPRNTHTREAHEPRPPQEEGRPRGDRHKRDSPSGGRPSSRTASAQQGRIQVTATIK